MQIRLLDILNTKIISLEGVIKLTTILQSTCLIPPLVLNIITWFNLHIERLSWAFSLVSENVFASKDLFCMAWLARFWYDFDYLVFN